MRESLGLPSGLSADIKEDMTAMTSWLFCLAVYFCTVTDQSVVGEGLLGWQELSRKVYQLGPCQQRGRAHTPVITAIA